MSDEIKQKSGIPLHIQQIIFSPSNQVLIDLDTMDLAVKDFVLTKEGKVEFFAPIGSRDLARNYFRTDKIYERVRVPDVSKKRGFRMEPILIKEITGMEAIALNLSTVLKVDTKTIESELSTYMSRGIPNIYVATLANRLALSNNFFDEKFPELVAKYGKNRWICSGDSPANAFEDSSAFDAVNEFVLKSRGSNFRVRTKKLRRISVIGD